MAGGTGDVARRQSRQTSHRRRTEWCIRGPAPTGRIRYTSSNQGGAESVDRLAQLAPADVRRAEKMKPSNSCRVRNVTKAASLPAPAAPSACDPQPPINWERPAQQPPAPRRRYNGSGAVDRVLLASGGVSWAEELPVLAVWCEITYLASAEVHDLSLSLPYPCAALQVRLNNYPDPSRKKLLERTACIPQIISPFSRTPPTLGL